MAVKDDAAASMYLAFDVCLGGETPAADGCAEVTPLDDAFIPLPGGSLDVPAFVRFHVVT